jgi:hypothetical protein
MRGFRTGLNGTYPVHWLGRHAVVTLPEHIYVSNAGQIRELLLSIINRGAAALIIDMTATASCDHAGADVYRRQGGTGPSCEPDLKLPSCPLDRDVDVALWHRVPPPE